jgi:hypothetical protein
MAQVYGVIICEPNDFVAEVDDRMPVLLRPAQFDHWLSGAMGPYGPFHRLRRRSICVTLNSTPRGGQHAMTSDEEVGRQILDIFMKHRVGAHGVLRRNSFIDVRDADFQRGLNKAVENRWIKIKLRDRYSYELTEAGLAAGLNGGVSPTPSD